MEIVVTVVGTIATAAATTAASKLTTLSVNRFCGKKNKPKAQCIKDEVDCINALITGSYATKGLSALQTNCIAQLRRLAYEIEDCVDLFYAGKTSGFANEIDQLKNKSVETRERIESCLRIRKGLVAGIPNEAVETREQILTALMMALGILGGTAQGGHVAGTSQGASDVPTELRVLLDDSNTSVSVGENPDCLLYFCLFPLNHDVSTKPLMRRWVAEGLVEEQDAAENLRFLIDKSIIRSIKTSNNGKVETCQRTSQVHACISEKSKSRDFVLVCDGAASIAELAEARRLSVHPSANVQLDLHDELPRLRTLAVFPADSANPDSYKAVLDFSRYEVLRVLDLKECAELSDNHHIDAIYKQVLMKYLSINLGSNIKGISRSIKKLNQLETLDLSGTGIETLVTVCKQVLLLPKLKHLLGKFQLNMKESNPFKSHSGLGKFLTDNSVLETLEGFVTGRRYGFQDLMSLMKSLRKVKIWCKPDASEEKLGVLSSAITEFIHRGTDAPHCGWSLSVDFAECSRAFVNEIVPVAAGNLDSLELRGTLSQFPPFVSGLSAIEELCLCSTGLSWEVIREGLMSGEVIREGRMSGGKGLKYLKLVEDNLGRIDIEPVHLRSIERICVVCVPRLDITIQPGALPELVSLRIHCQDLDAIPGTPGIEITHMEKLKEVALHRDIKNQIRTQWQQAVDDHPNGPVLLFTEGP